MRSQPRFRAAGKIRIFFKTNRAKGLENGCFSRSRTKKHKRQKQKQQYYGKILLK